MRELQKAVLNWYSFDHGARALALGPDADILAELLESRQLKTDTDPQKNCKYDYIAAVDLVETSAEKPEQLIKELYELLSDDGTLLICFRNRFGLKYLCGGTDDIVRTPMQGIRGELPGLMAPEQAKELLQKAGFLNQYTYYLMPDARFTQAVYTDDYLPKDSIRDRVFAYDPYESPFLATESELYDDVVREGVLPHTANAFLVECHKGAAHGEQKRVVYAALSTDRGPEHGYATILYSDGSACKKTIWSEGNENLKRLYDNLETLRSRGIPVVPQKMTEDGVEMPLVTDPQLMEYLRKMVVSEDRDAFIEVFRQMERDILTSSDTCSISEEEAKTCWGATLEQLGTILETGYIDMIPYNGFFSDGRIMYYDQEFTVQNCPLRYILFRAIRYTWIHIPEAENLIRMEEIKEIFGLTDLWKNLLERENRFVSENRNWKKYSKIYEWTNIDREGIKKRVNTLTEGDLTSRIQKIQLNLLKQVDTICRKNGIHYMAVYGTLLGAVRHRGFVPWDNDIDIAMPREDYERFIRICDEQLDSNYFLQTPESDSSCFYGGYCKLRDSRTSALEYRNIGKSCNQGIWIDIFPLDYCPKSEDRRMKLQKKITFWQRIRLAHLYQQWANAMGDVRGGEISLYYILRKFISQEKPVRKLRDLFRSCEPEGYRSVLARYYGGRENKDVYPEQECMNLTELPFENMRIMAPAAYDNWLRKWYGEDYMKMPDENDRYGYGGVLYDPETPFAEKVGENQ